MRGFHSTCCEINVCHAAFTELATSWPVSGVSVSSETGGTNQPLLKWQKYLWDSLFLCPLKQIGLVFHTLRKDGGNLVTAASYITLKIESIQLYCIVLERLSWPVRCTIYKPLQKSLETNAESCLSVYELIENHMALLWLYLLPSQDEALKLEPYFSFSRRWIVLPCSLLPLFTSGKLILWQECCLSLPLPMEMESFIVWNGWGSCSLLNYFPGSNAAAELQHLWEEPHCCPPAFATDRFRWLLTLEISKVLCLMDAEIWVASFLLLSLFLAWSVALSSDFYPRWGVSFLVPQCPQCKPHLSRLQVAPAKAVSSGL